MPITARSRRTADSCEAAPKSIHRGDGSVLRWTGQRRLRALSVGLGALALTLALGAATANAQLFSQVSAFGTEGSGAGQSQGPAGVAAQQQSGNVYVADSDNARVDKFGPGGNFIAAFGWGVADGKAQAEVCTSSCRAGIPGSGPGQFSTPSSVAVGGPGSASAGKVYVGDFTNGRVEKFDADGNFISSLDGSTTPQGKYQGLGAVAVDQNGNLWTVDFNTSNVDEFDAHGNFLQQWNSGAASGFGTTGIAVDSSNNAVYLAGNTELQRFTLNGTPGPVIDHGGLADDSVAVDPQTHDVYLDQEGDVQVFDPTGFHLDTVPNTGPGGNSAWVAVGHNHLYVSGPGLRQVNVFGVPPAGPPLITSEAETETTLTAATLGAAIVPLGHDTTCAFQFVDDAGFQASGYNAAMTVPCTPADLGSSFTYQHVSASETGLKVGVTYHFRVVATSAAGTTTGGDTTFTMADDWAPFNRCPVDDPAMLATTGINTVAGSGTGSICLASNSPHGSITLGKITTATGNTNLQAGLVLTAPLFNATFSVIPPAGGALVADPVQLSTPVGPVTAVTESAGAPSNFNLFAGVSVGAPIITVPIKIHLENPVLGQDCFIGSDQNPIDLNPENTDLSNASAKFEGFDPTGVPDPLNGPLNTIVIAGAVQGDDTFAVPGATGCGSNGSLDAAVDAVAGVPSPSGSNHLVLDDAASALALSVNLLGLPVPGHSSLTGPQFAADWHVRFG